MDKLAVGNRIRKQRELLGYTREELAEKVDISSKFCADIELGSKGMSIETLCRFSDVLLLSTDYILFGNSDNVIDEETTHLIKKCNPENMVFLKNIIRNFIQAYGDKQ